ncbi:hypothetical protein [Clostridium sp. LIBA-8841]|uniref:hypothetical protein n=1 Tax=Clostridium sp. LIBA-8841 TaxID=2987530 RepID=UPI002AC39578|nr:hypothetical protein [Clostridium sp. LIBA-8841]MDZ5254319.1 hypothetical protein [Clostridium sp. LIBA-8841]
MKLVRMIIMAGEILLIVLLLLGMLSKITGIDTEKKSIDNKSKIKVEDELTEKLLVCNILI